MKIDRLLRASGFEPTHCLRKLLRETVGGPNRLYRWVLIGPAEFLRWSLDLIEPAYMMTVNADPDSWDGLDVTISVRDSRTFREINYRGYDSSGDKF